MGRHEALGQSDEWYTPPEVFEAMGVTFDLDVASPGRAVVPWVPACEHFTHRSLERDWFGFVWMNCPFGKRNGCLPWAQKFVAHGNGVALMPNRTGAPWMNWMLSQASAAFFWSPKIKMLKPDGSRGVSPGYGTVLVACGDTGVQALRNISGHGVLFEKARAAA